jgi:hypothetical protein
MSNLVNRSREEGSELRPFIGLEVFEALLARSSLVASTLYGEVAISPNGSGQIKSLSADTVGYRFEFGSAPDEIKVISEEFGLKMEQLDLVVIIRDQKYATLHEAEVLKVVNGSVFNPAVILLDRDQPRSRILVNRYTGFEFEAFLVLNCDLSPRPLKPRQKGTILAQTKFTIDVLDQKGGIKPYPLTAEVRAENDLPSGVWLWVEEQGDSLLEATALKDAFRIYVDEELLNLMSRLSGPSRLFALQTVIAPAITQIVCSTSAELRLPANDGFEFDGNGSAVLKLLFKKFRKVSSGLTTAEFIAILRENPARAVAYTLAQTTGPGGTKKDIKNWINELIGENDVPTA